MNNNEVDLLERAVLKEPYRTKAYALKAAVALHKCISGKEMDKVRTYLSDLLLSLAPAKDIGKPNKCTVLNTYLSGACPKYAERTRSMSMAYVRYIMCGIDYSADAATHLVAIISHTFPKMVRRKKLTDTEWINLAISEEPSKAAIHYMKVYDKKAVTTDGRRLHIIHTPEWKDGYYTDALSPVGLLYTYPTPRN